MSDFMKYDSDRYQIIGGALRNACFRMDSPTSDWTEKRNWLWDIGVRKIRKKSVRSREVSDYHVQGEVDKQVRKFEKYCLTHWVQFQIGICSGNVREVNNGDQGEIKFAWDPPTARYLNCQDPLTRAQKIGLARNSYRN